jgi:hypothetical protein
MRLKKLNCPFLRIPLLRFNSLIGQVKLAQLANYLLVSVLLYDSKLGIPVLNASSMNAMKVLIHQPNLRYLLSLRN